MVQMIQFLHMQRVPFHFVSSVLNSQVCSIALIQLLIGFHNLAPSHMKHYLPCVFVLNFGKVNIVGSR